MRITFTLSQPSPRVFCYRRIGSCSHCVLIQTLSLLGSSCLLQPHIVYEEENGPNHVRSTCTVKTQAWHFFHSIFSQCAGIICVASHSLLKEWAKLASLADASCQIVHVGAWKDTKPSSSFFPALTVLPLPLFALSLQPLAKRWRLMPKDAAKMPESAWKLVFYTMSWSYSTYLLFLTSYPFFHDPPSVFYSKMLSIFEISSHFLQGSVPSRILCNIKKEALWRFQ